MDRPSGHESIEVFQPALRFAEGQPGLNLPVQQSAMTSGAGQREPRFPRPALASIWCDPREVNPSRGSGRARSLPRPDSVTQTAIQNEPTQGQQAAQGEADH